MEEPSWLASSAETSSMDAAAAPIDAATAWADISWITEGRWGGGPAPFLPTSSRVGFLRSRRQAL